MDDATLALKGSCPGCRCEGVDLAGHTVIKPSSKSDDDVRLLHRKVCVRAPVHTKHVKTLVVVLVESAETLHGSGHRDVTVGR